jgi:1-acyl-sn-glycerol-3-phosphate acyltransferase
MKKKRYWLRSTVFNVLFFGVTAFFAVVYAPFLFLSQKKFGYLIRFWLRTVAVLEYAFLDLKYKVEGWENLPKEGSYIVAAKHQSAYETLKLHLIFRDPAVILKKELLYIPLFGWYLQKSGAIAIDRSTPDTAHKSIQDGAVETMARNQPIIIFPQGTRVAAGVGTDKAPYKVGVARLQENTGLPIVPVALNSGAFWARNSYFKHPGTVTFKILKPIMPGMERSALMKKLEDEVERESNALVEISRATNFDDVEKSEKRRKIFFIVLLIGLLGIYCVWWQKLAETIKHEYAALHDDAAPLPVITGFPFWMKIYLDTEQFMTPDGTMTLRGVNIYGFPLPLANIHIEVKEIQVSNLRWRSPLVMHDTKALLSYWNNTITVHDLLVMTGDLQASAGGTIDISNMDLPIFDAMIAIRGHQQFLQYAAQNNMVDGQSAAMMMMGFNAMQDSQGVVSVPVTQRERKLYAGPFAFAEIPERKPVITDPLSGGMHTPPAPSR